MNDRAWSLPGIRARRGDSRIAPAGVIRLLAILAFYALIAFLALYWPIFHLTTHLTGTLVTDYFHFHWNYWWIRHALTAGLDVYQTNFVMAPYTSSLAYHTLSPFWYPLWALIEPLAGTVPAMTAIFFAAYTFTGTSFYALLRHERVSSGLALVGGVMLQLTPLMFSAAFWTTVNIMGWFWLPLMILTWDAVARSVVKPGWRGWVWVILFGLVLWAAVLTDIQVPLFAAPLVIPYGLWTLWRAPNRSARARIVVAGVLAVALGLALMTFIGPLRPLLAFDRAGLAPTPADRAVRIPFPDGFFSRIPIPEDVSVGALLLPLTGLALLINLLTRRLAVTRLPRRWFWLALMIVPLILSPGAFITIGETTITLPYLWVHQLFGGQFRYPERFVPVFLIPAVLFIGMTLTPLLARLPRRWRYALPSLLLLLVAADSWLFRSVAIQPIPPRYAFYEAMGHEPYDYVVIEVPTGASSGEGLVGEQRFAALEFYGITHGKRMVNGHISRVNFQHYWPLRTDDPLLAWLGQRRWLEPDLVRPELERIIPEWPVGYIVVHQDMIGRNGPTNQEIIGYFNQLPDLLCPVWVERDAVVFRTAWHPDGCPPRTPPETEPGLYTVDIGTEGDERFIGWGWHWPEQVAGLTLRWMGEYPRTRLYVDLPPGEYELSLSTQAFWEPRQLTVRVNDVVLGQASVAVEGLQTLTFTLPADGVGEGKHLTLTLDPDAVVVPADVGQSADPRKLALAVDWIQFRRVR